MSQFDYIILDIESYLMRACSACKELKEISPGEFSEVYKLANGKAYLKDVVEGFKEQLDAKDVIIVLGDNKKNFRKKINPNYKHNRKAKPLMYDKLFGWLIDTFTTVYLEGLEADDTARIIFEDDDNFSGRKVIVSVDKDFYSVPCNFYRDNPADRKVVAVTRSDALQNLFVQVLEGDKTDGYEGCRNIGPVTARSLVNAETTIEDIKQIYIDNDMTEEDFERNLFMAHILGKDNYDMKTSKVIYKTKKGEYIL